ncbi:hypothetical protein [Hydrogenophaga sp.]|uniref:hypothetical protein n=1 Tax=Hydrogenophaga sp. TaxID=1904254 RepID=UPI003D0D42F8
MSTDFTPWFTVDANGTPAREGVYETTGLGIPGESHSVLQHGFRYWGGTGAWGDLGATPAAAASVKDHNPVFPFTVRHWRGRTAPAP